MHQRSVRDLQAHEFEWVCGGVIAEIARDRGRTPTGAPELMAPTTDGGVEAKIATTTGALAVQCKAFNRAGFDNEVAAVKKSFDTFLARPEHAAVDVYVWCSTASRTSGTGDPTSRKGRTTKGTATKAVDAIAEMLAAAAAKNRTVAVEVLFAEDLDRIIREDRPEYLTVMNAQAPLRFDDVARYSSARADEILARLGDSTTTPLTFPAHRTAAVLDRLTDSARPGAELRLDGIVEPIDEIGRRSQHVPQHPAIGTAFRAALAAVTAAFTPLAGRSTAPPADADRAITTLDDAAEHAIASAMSTLEDIQKSPATSGDEVLDTVRRDSALRAVLDVARSLLALRARLEPIRCEAAAVLTRRLLITGRWGTGKSHQIAEYTRRALAEGTPVLLLRARDFTQPDAPILSQPWRGAFDNEGAEPAVIAAMLDAIGHHGRSTGSAVSKPLVLIIDGLNEAGIRNLPPALDRLLETVARFPRIRLIISQRRDRMPDGKSPLPELVHASPGHVVLSRSVERALKVVPGTQWHAALTNPLLASVAVRVLTDRPQATARLLSRTALFDAWVDLLADETARALERPATTVRRVIAAIAEAGGRAAVPAIARVTALPSDVVDAVADRLADDGLLESDPTDADAVRFRWEALSDTLRLRRALADGILDELLRGVHEDRMPAMADFLAELLPQQDPPRELPEFTLPGISATERDLAFTLSLVGRTDESITPAALAHAERLLRGGGDPSQGVVRSVLGAPHRRRLDTGWLAAQLREVSLRSRTVFWPAALEQLCERSEGDQQELQEQLGWLAQERWPHLPSSDAGATIDLLAWMTCADDATGLPALAISALTEILQQHPSQLEPALVRLQDVEDDHPREALLSAASGVIGRWPQEDAARIIREVCEGLLAGPHRPASYAALAALHTATDAATPMHAFLRAALPPLPTAWPRRVRGLISDSDRSRFADGRSDAQSERFEGRILRALGVPIRARSAVVGPDPESEPGDHGRSLVRGRWLARQYAEHPTGSSMIMLGLTPVKAGTPPNDRVALLTDPGTSHEEAVDPTVPLALRLHGTDEAVADAWWAVRSVGDHSDGATSLTVTDPAGTEWIVVDGLFRLLDPPRAAAHERPLPRLGRKRWMLGRAEDDGLPMPGRRRHEVVRIDHTRLSPLPEGSASTVSRRELRHESFADGFTLAVSDGAVVVPSLSSEVPPLTVELLRLLEARWTGWGRDAVDADGELLITDPAVGRHAPHAVVVRRAPLLAALKRTGRTLTVSLTISDNISGRSTASRAVTIG